MKKENIKARININRSLWAEVRAEATREGKKAEDVAAELIAVGLKVKRMKEVEK